MDPVVPNVQLTILKTITSSNFKSPIEPVASLELKDISPPRFIEPLAGLILPSRVEATRDDGYRIKHDNTPGKEKLTFYKEENIEDKIIKKHLSTN